MPRPLAPDLRRRAMQCAEEANRPDCSPEKRQRLLKMRQAYLALADEEDWLAGRPSTKPGEGY
jgi:hypothetical protein